MSDEFDQIVDAPFDDALSQRYLVYALSTITARSLPDLRDGLKPVHRRLLWAMRLLKLDPAAGYKKCARVVGDVIGKYHPHGDQSVYDAMVRLAQDFSLRYPLVDGQGNFGNVDGDNAAAMRYTEARLTQAANDLMAGLDEGTVDFRPTYNGEEEEPEVFPGLFPNLLANGASGIAVGMATSIPPHNVAEIDRRGGAADRREGTGAGDDGSAPRARQGTRLSDRRHRCRQRRSHFSRPTRPDAAPSGCGRKWEIEKVAAGHVDRGDHRNPLSGAQGQADRADRRPDHRAQAADPRRRARRIGRGDPDRPRAAQPHRRSADADGQPVPADRPRDPRLAQPQRARRPAHAARDGPEAGARRMGGVPDRGAGAPRAAPGREDRRPARAARGLYHRLPEPRPGDPDHPHRGRAQADHDRRIRADRPPGRGDPQHAPAQLAQARGDAAPAGARRADQGARRAREADRLGRPAADPAQEGPSGAEGPLWSRAPSSAGAAP